jgi:hypothetical protein
MVLIRIVALQSTPKTEGGRAGWLNDGGMIVRGNADEGETYPTWGDRDTSFSY